ALRSTQEIIGQLLRIGGSILQFGIDLVFNPSAAPSNLGGSLSGSFGTIGTTLSDLITRIAANLNLSGVVDPAMSFIQRLAEANPVLLQIGAALSASLLGPLGAAAGA